MDIQRPASVARQKRVRRIWMGVATLLVVAGVSLALSRLEPAAPTVERATVWVDTVKRGSMLRQVRGLGTLVPVDEARRWLPSATQGRVERIILRPGAQVTPDTVILELADPQLQQQLMEAETQLRASEADLASLRARLDTERLNQRSIAATVEADFEQARLEREVNEDLAKDGLVSKLILKQSTVRSESLRTRSQLEKERVGVSEESVLFTLRRQQVDQLRVRAGMSGVLEQVPVDVGQQVAPGTNVARVADPTRLKAELRIAETQARDLTIGQLAQVDTRNGIIAGKVARIDPAAQNGTVTVDITLEGELPRGARPDLSVDGTVELERLDNVLYVGRPAFGQENSAVGLFLVSATTGEADRVQVQLGRSSVNTIEIKTGAKEGDQLVLSDMSAWDAFGRVRLR